MITKRTDSLRNWFLHSVPTRRGRIPHRNCAISSIYQNIISYNVKPTLLWLKQDKTIIFAYVVGEIKHKFQKIISYNPKPGLLWL